MNFIKNILEKKYPILKDEKYIKDNVKPIKIINDNSFIPENIFIENLSLFKIENLLIKFGDFKKYQSLFDFLRRNKEINTIGELGIYIRNGYYPSPDAEVYAGMIASYQPENIIEIGSGFSTIIARNTINYLSLKTQITIVDPQPRTDINNYADKKIYKPVEQTKLEDYLLPQSMIFIDSSHILRAGGDLPFIYNNIIPNLPKDTLIHVHDIFLPYDYPNIYYKWYYNQQSKK